MEITRQEIKLIVEVLEKGMPCDEKKREKLAKIWYKLTEELKNPFKN